MAKSFKFCAHFHARCVISYSECFFSESRCSEKQSTCITLIFRIISFICTFSRFLYHTVMLENRTNAMYMNTMSTCYWSCYSLGNHFQGVLPVPKDATKLAPNGPLACWKADAREAPRLGSTAMLYVVYKYGVPANWTGSRAIVMLSTKLTLVLGAYLLILY